MTPDERDARSALEETFGPGAAPHDPSAVVSAWSPGRCTLVGEHVDYAGGRVLCMATDLGIGVAVRPSPDGVWRFASRGRRIERASAHPAGDLGDRPFAAALGLRETGVEIPPLEVAAAASLPEGAGLSSSAALICATLVALLRLTGSTLEAERLCEVALHAERDIVGVPCGPLDQRAVVLSPTGGALLLDFSADSAEAVPWRVSAVRLAVCFTGAAHDVGGEGYRTRREQVDRALSLLGRATWPAVELADLVRTGLPPPLAGRATHVVTESARAGEAAVALRDGDPARLGALMSASHASLRDDFEVSTPRLDAVVAAAQGEAGCFGARLVGAGFGGSVIALVEPGATARCRQAMAAAAGSDAGQTWELGPSPGIAALVGNPIG